VLREKLVDPPTEPELMGGEGDWYLQIWPKRSKTESVPAMSLDWTVQGNIAGGVFATMYLATTKYTQYQIVYVRITMNNCTGKLS
jgi:hypothetical protein